MNIVVGPKEDRQLMTGLHTIADIYCSDCREDLGWKYEKAYEESQNYKKGFDAIGEHTGDDHDRNIMVPFGGKPPGSKSPGRNRLPTMPFGDKTVGATPVSYPTVLEKSAYRRSAGPSRTPKKRLLDHPLRRQHRDALPPTTLTKTCIGGRFVAQQASKMSSRGFRVQGIIPA
ncbi:hypothetical protein M5K25_009732 [Dendrobium thyrsiflorum]|uniref:Yippee domain-containing protein n=1 Tax=Dendrobium thyrsiflorum TaxID=117978 RepID=A0ABD0VDJ5_DENTH